jgi:hypothetical protein
MNSANTQKVCKINYSKFFKQTFLWRPKVQCGVNGIFFCWFHSFRLAFVCNGVKCWRIGCLIKTICFACFQERNSLLVRPEKRVKTWTLRLTKGDLCALAGISRSCFMPFHFGISYHSTRIFGFLTVFCSFHERNSAKGNFGIKIWSMKVYLRVAWILISKLWMWHDTDLWMKRFLWDIETYCDSKC